MTRGKNLVETRFCGVDLQLHADASLYLPETGLLVVSDLHLEKGQAQSKAAPCPDLIQMKVWQNYLLLLLVPMLRK